MTDSSPQINLRELSICDRIDLAYAEISQTEFKKSKMVWLRKPGTNFKNDEGDGYAILSIADILDPIRRTHGKYGVKLQLGVPICDPEHFPDEGITKNGNTVHFIGHVHYKLVGKDVRDVLEGDVSCEARDNSDKLRNKLVTNGLRTLYRTLYGIDGDDSQDPEEINLPVKEEKKAESPMSDFNQRFLLGKKEKKEETPAIVTEPPKVETEADIVIPATEVPATDITADRPLEELIASIIKYNRATKLRPIVQEYAKKWGGDPSFWTEAQVKECFKKCVEGGRN